MDKDIIDRPIIDPNLSAYEKFFDHDWAKQIFEKAKDSSLIGALSDLILSWRSANGAHILPWIMVESLKGFANGEMQGEYYFRNKYSKKIIDGLVEQIGKKMQARLNIDQRMALKRVVSTIEQDANKSLMAAQENNQFDVNGYWNFLIRNTEFAFCVLGIQRINYGSLFFAYEDFLSNIIRIKEPKYSSKKEPIRDAFERHFGIQLTEYCWKDEEVDFARLVRNALAHNGGRLGKDLEKYKSRFVNAADSPDPLIYDSKFNLVDEKIQITPENTKFLFNILKQRVSRIVNELSK